MIAEVSLGGWRVGPELSYQNHVVKILASIVCNLYIAYFVIQSNTA